MYVEFKEVRERQDYISIDRRTAISAEGEIFHVGDMVKHTGKDDNDTAIIESFTINEDSYDIEALTTKGRAKISFIYH